MPELASAVPTSDDGTSTGGSSTSAAGCSALTAGRPKRLQDELDAADEKLRQVAQHFSVEWKAFLAYAMKLKQETPEFASFPDKQRLEDLLLRSQSGLVMLREMQQRRDEKWRQLLPWWRATAEDAAQQATDAKAPSMPVSDAFLSQRRDRRPPCTAPSESTESAVVEHRRAFLSRYASFLDALVFMCQRFLTRRRLLPDTVPSGDTGERVQDPAMVQRMAKKLQWALNVRERLRQAIEQNSNNNDGDEASTAGLDALLEDDVQIFARFQYLSLQHGAVFERFFIRLRWLPTAYRYHVRHRMLELAHQQTARSVPLSPLAQLEKAKVSDSVSGTMQCPLFPIRRHPIERDTTRMLASLRIGVARGSNWVAAQLTVRSLLQSLVEQTRLPSAVTSKLPPSKDDGMSLLPGKVVRTRWDLSQMTTLEETEVHGGQARDQQREAPTRELHGTRTDVLLRNELALLDVDDAEYVRVRLQSLVKCHFERAIVETTTGDAATEQRSARLHGSSSSSSATTNSDVEKAKLLLERRAAIGATEELPSELLDVWYTTRYIVCRQLRLRLLRSLNYQHFLWTMRRMQAAEVRRMSALGAKGGSSASAATRKKAELHEGCVMGKWRVQELASGESVVLFEDTEHIFPAARRDLALLEAHLLDVASVFVEKQQRGVFDAMANHSGGGSACGDAYPFSFVLAVDRMQVLTDLLEVELRFQQIKVIVATQMLVSGHEYLAADGIDTGGDLIGRLLQRRPRIDFEHAYFYDSYVAETVQLELQRELFRAMSAVGAQICASSAVRDTEELWLHQQLIADVLATTYMRDVHSVLRRAEQQWFVTTSVTELHALQQAIHERMLVIWKSLLAIELPPGEQHSLPHTASSFFRGDGWRAGVKTDVLIDVCAGDDDGVKSSTNVLRLVDALELLVWRHELGLEVYEASLLEKIWGVQQGFVDLLRSSRIDDPVLLFHDSVDGSKEALVTITDVLSSEADALVDPTSKREHDFKAPSRPEQRLTHKLRKNVADWLRTHVRQDRVLLDAYWARCHGVVWMQQHYRWSLYDLVSYNDLVGAEIVEFAATSPFYFLSAFETPSSASGSDGTNSGGGADHALSLKAVHWKYMDEIVERIEDAAKRSCNPYWIPLMELQHMLCMRLRPRHAEPQHKDDESSAAPEIVDDDEELLPLPAPTELVPCVSYLVEASTIPRLLVALSSILEQFRHEERLMRDLFPSDWRERCAFVSSDEDDEHSRSEGDALSAWLHRKLEQLKLDVKAAAGTGNNSAIAQEKCPLDLSIPFVPSRLLVGVAHDGDDTHASTDEPKLLLRIPSTSSLLAWFSVKQSIDSAATMRDETEAALLALIEIYESFRRSIEVLRAETALGFFLKYEPDASSQARRLGFRGTSVRRLPRFTSSRGLYAKTSTRSRTSLLSPASSASSSSSSLWFFGKELLGAWQQALHRSILALHDRLVERLGASAGMRDLFVPTDWDSLRRRHQTMLFRREVAVALRDVNAEWKARLRCAVMALTLQALSYRTPSAVEHREPEIAQLHRLEAALLMVDERSHGVVTQRRTGNAGSFPVLLRLRSHEDSVDGAEFYRAISDVHDVSYLRRLGDWLDLVFALVRDHMKMKRASNAEAAGDGDVEAAIHELERAVERYRVFYRLPADAEPLILDADHDVVVASSSSSPMDKQQQRSSSQAGSVSGTRLRMKTPAIVALLSTSTAAAPVSVLARALRAITRSSLRQDDALSSQNHNDSNNSVVLPTLARLEFQVEMFRVHLQIQWIEDDVQHMQRHYESFLEQRRLFHAHVKQARKTTATTRSAAAAGTGASSSSSPSSPRSSPSSTAETHRDVTRWLLRLSRYFRPPVADAGEGNEKETHDSGGRYVIPADDMVELLNAVNQHLDQHYAQMLLTLEQAGDEHERESRRLRSLADERQRRVEALQHDEQLKRETYAVDRRYELVCQLEKQRHELSLLASRKDTERELLRRELTVAFEKRLHEMHVALLAKQHKFEEYRHTMQQDLKQQLQAAHAQLVHQLVDQSGSMSVETKTNFLASLDGHVATQAALQQENLALKHTLLKLQTLHEMHEQTRQLHTEKERATAEAFRLREQQLVGENAQLTHQIKQLEAELARTAQDRTYHQIKLNALERQTEAAAERRRQAKVRALSAPFRRHAHMLVTPEMEENNPDAVENTSPASPAKKIVPRLPDFDAEQEAFERSHEVAIRTRSNTNPKQETADASRVETQCQNTIRHYQNEIRRLQQQLARESRLKAALLERVSAQSSGEQTTTTAALPLDEPVVASASASASPVASAGTTPLQTRRRLLLVSPSSPMASPRLRAASASTATPRRPMTGSSNAPRRPSTSIGSSPASSSSNHSHSRSSSESADSSNSSWTPRQVPALLVPSPGAGNSSSGNQTKPPRSAQSATPHRRFEVVKRDESVLSGGVAGVANPFSPREPLPYR